MANKAYMPKQKFNAYHRKSIYHTYFLLYYINTYTHTVYYCHLHLIFIKAHCETDE